MKKVLWFALYIFLFCLFTLISQTGGLILLLCIPLYRFIGKRISKRWLRNILKPASFITVYLLITVTLTPLFASFFGRQPLPINSNAHLKPLSNWTWILNRHYVSQNMIDVLESSTDELSVKNERVVISYLDGCFPFIDNFPLLPHISHDDGKKLDLAFFYKGPSGQLINGDAPSFIGYGVYEGPKEGEKDQPYYCEAKGYWHYSIIETFVPQGRKQELTFDQARTKELIQTIANNRNVSKIFIEPHLKNRLNLNSPKIRFHGCQAVRHDDHIHVEVN
ncbi:MAG: energy-coupling factor transporter transmembrane protein EcfT [Parvicellaceae bacterium]|jgi:energy-coupling factor transporter transmembrane protein EcfT